MSASSSTTFFNVQKLSQFMEQMILRLKGGDFNRPVFYNTGVNSQNNLPLMQ
jgi:hypothetical protein